MPFKDPRKKREYQRRYMQKRRKKNVRPDDSVRPCKDVRPKNVRPDKDADTACSELDDLFE